MSRVFQALERAERWRGRRPAAVLEAMQDGHRAGHSAAFDWEEYDRLAGTIVQAMTAAPFTTMMLTSRAAPPSLVSC